jgi:hypothetical protein
MSKHQQKSNRQTEDPFLDISDLEQYAWQIARSEGRNQITEQDWQRVCAECFRPPEVNAASALSFELGEAESTSWPETPDQRGHRVIRRGIGDENRAGQELAEKGLRGPRISRKTFFREPRGL